MEACEVLSSPAGQGVCGVLACSGPAVLIPALLGRHSPLYQEKEKVLAVPFGDINESGRGFVSFLQQNVWLSVWSLHAVSGCRSLSFHRASALQHSANLISAQNQQASFHSTFEISLLTSGLDEVLPSLHL